MYVAAGGRQEITWSRQMVLMTVGKRLCDWQGQCGHADTATQKLGRPQFYDI